MLVRGDLVGLLGLIEELSESRSVVTRSTLAKGLHRMQIEVAVHPLLHLLPG